MRVGIVLGSIREGRFGESVAKWVLKHTPQRDGVEYELIDLKSFNVPLLTAATIPGMANKQYDSDEVTAWSKAVDACDAYVFITAEYNHGVPGGLKNAFDTLASEWQGKPVAFVSYGAENGVRAVEQWRQIVSNFSMIDIRQQVSMSIFTEGIEDGVAPNERRADELAELFNQLLGMADKLQA